MRDAQREQRIDELLDKQAITELVHAYANAADRHDHDKMRALYHPDAIDDHGHFAKGPAMDFIDKLPEIQRDMAILHHNPRSYSCTSSNTEGKVRVRQFHT